MALKNDNNNREQGFFLLAAFILGVFVSLGPPQCAAVYESKETNDG